MKLRECANLFVIATAVVLTSTVAIVSAQTWPTKPIKIVLGFPPGGATDILSRDFAAKLSEELKQQVIIENKPGAGGTIGADIVAKAAPDGYTLTIGTTSNHAIAVSLYKKLPYDPVKDFAFITMLAVSQNVVVINPAVPASNPVPPIPTPRATNTSGPMQHTDAKNAATRPPVEVAVTAAISVGTVPAFSVA